MGNCLSGRHSWTPLRRNQFAFEEAFAQPSFNEYTKETCERNTNGESLPICSDVNNFQMTSNIVGVPVMSAVGIPQVTGNYATSVEAPKDMGNFQQLTRFQNCHVFTYKELTVATDYFRPDLILGEGGFGLVFKGVIDENVRPGFKSTKVAVKELNPDGYQGDREWLAEVNYLGQFSHPNLVKLIGYCYEDEHRLLVYEYMACGSLETHLFRRRNQLTWPIRMKIALDAAKGLAFLHGAERPIIYRDFKTSNILLDAGFNAKLSDFGLAKEGPMGDQTHVSTRVMGTYGYAAPEYIMTGHLTAKSDVYGFGVVLLEILVGKRALDKHRPNQEHNLVDWARPLLIRTTKLLRIIDPKMQGQYSSRTACQVAYLAYRCLSENPKFRPTMKEVVELLENYNHEEMLYQIRKTTGTLQDDGDTAFVSPYQQQQPNKAESGRADAVAPGRRRVKPGERSRSDPPPKEFDPQHSPSLDCGGFNSRGRPSPDNYGR